MTKVNLQHRIKEFGEAGVMPVDEFQRIILRVANQIFTRYWMHWNYPLQPQIMVIQTEDTFDDLIEVGFTKDEFVNRYFIQRA